MAKDPRRRSSKTNVGGNMLKARSGTKQVKVSPGGKKKRKVPRGKNMQRPFGQ